MKIVRADYSNAIKEIARVLGISYKAAFFMVRELRRSFYVLRQEDI